MRGWNRKRATPTSPGAPENRAPEDVAHATASRSERSRGTRVDVAALLAELPMQSAIARALVVLDDPNASAQDVATVLQSDPAMCARALQLANAAHFGMSDRVTSVDQAVVRLGTTTMRTLVVSSGSGLFGRAEDLPPGFWHHSIAVAAAAAIGARQCSVARGDAICAGLLHDLGTALLYRFDRDHYAARIAVGAEQAENLLDDETDRYGADHAALGAEALAAWNLPPVIINALRTHHDDPSEVADKLGRVLILGEALARAAFDPPTFDHEPAAAPDTVFAALGLRVASVDTYVDRTAEETQTLAALLGN
jgi:putative nucleotidyltransferase with HDIG domain